jgi:cobalt-precorrin 5A hydrolase
MTLKAAAFTDRGAAWGEKLGVPVERPMSALDWAAEAFQAGGALLFIGAVGIAVRAIAPHIRSKLTDPAVLVMDELGRHVIPILSGHIGGANELALEIAEKTGAEAVITTATDLNGLPAIDTWAVKNDCAIENPEAIRAVSAAALSGKPVGVMITERRLTPPFPVTLVLRPRTLVLGAGCRRGVPPGRFEENALDFLKSSGVSPLSVRALATIDRKADEPAFLDFCEKYRLPLLTYTAAELSKAPGVFAKSEYVLRAVGVDNVCERAAALASGGRLLTGKTRYEGVALALAGEEDT